MAVLKIFVAAAIAVLCIAFYPYLTPQNISLFIKENSTAAPLVFIAVCGVRPVLFFLPAMGLTIAAGTLFGVVYGTLYVAIGGAVSTIVGFYFARWIGRETAEKLVSQNKLLKEFVNKTNKNGKKAVLYLRIINIPWDIVSYWAGLSGISFKDFYIASMLPLLPVSFLYTYFGSNVFKPASAGFIIPLAIILMMGAIPYAISSWKKRRHG